MIDRKNNNLIEPFDIICSLPRNLIVSGCIWIILCLILIISVCSIKYSHNYTFDIIYIGQQDTIYGSQGIFKIKNSPLNLSKIEYSKEAKIEFDNNIYMDLIITNLFSQESESIIEMQLSKETISNLLIGTVGKLRIEIIHMPLIKSIFN